MVEKNFIEGWARLLKLVAATGTTLFALILAATWLGESQLRASAHHYLVQEVTSRVEDELGKDVGGAVEAASRLSKLINAEADGTAEKLRRFVPPLVNKWLLEHCECELSPSQSKWAGETATDTAIEWSKPWEKRLKRRAEGLRDFAKGHYDERWSALLTELRIFSCSNSALFLFCFLILKLRPLRAGLVVGPLSLLTLAAIGAAYYWVAGQDWFWNILTNDYLGWGYLGVVAIFVIVLSHAGLTTSD